MENNTETKQGTDENILVNNIPESTDNETLSSKLAGVQSQSPISVSGSDSAVALSASITPLPLNSNKQLSGPSLSIDQVFNDNREAEGVNNEEKENQQNSVKIESEIQIQINDEHNNKMDIDEENKTKNLKNKINDKEVENGNNDKNDNLNINHNETAKNEMITELQKILETMENTRLELVPLLLDNIEQAKNGELSIKDLDNACGRIRVRLNKLQESRNKVINGIQILQENNNGVKFTPKESETRIKLKNDAITNIIDSISSKIK